MILEHDNFLSCVLRFARCFNIVSGHLPLACCAHILCIVLLLSLFFLYEVSQRPATYGNGKRKGAGKLVIAGASFTMNTGDHENSYRRSTRGQNHELHQIQRGRDSITEFSSQDTYAGSSYLNDDSTTNIDGLRRSRRKSAGRNSTISRSPDVVCLSSDDDNDGDDDNEVEEVEMDHEPNVSGDGVAIWLAMSGMDYYKIRACAAAFAFAEKYCIWS